MKSLISSIWIPKDRQRRTIDDSTIDSLAVSMQNHGLIQPIVVVREPDGIDGHALRLVAGERRLRAAKKLGWTEINADDFGDLSPLQREEVELDENLLHENLPWPEECAAKKRIWEIRAELYGETVGQVAEHVGDSKGGFWEDARLAKAIEIVPELAKAKNKTQAQNKLRLIQRRMGLEERAKERAVGSDELGDIANHIHLGDCLSIMKEWEDGIVHCIVTDPPYGIQLDSGETKKANPHPAIYVDDHYDVMDLVALTAKEAYRLLVSNSHAYFFFDIKAYALVLKLLQDAGFVVDPIPLIWVKNLSGQVNHPDSRFGSGYEACFFCRKGNRALLKQGQSNALQFDVVPSGKKIHPTEKPVALLRALIETSTVAGETVLDMFGGSGSTSEAAIQTGRNFITIEKDVAFHQGILERLSQSSTSKGLDSKEEVDEDEARDWEEAAK